MPLSSSIVSSRAIPTSSGKLFPPPAMASMARAIPRLCLTPEEVLHCPCSLPVSLIHRTVAVGLDFRALVNFLPPFMATVALAMYSGRDFSSAWTRLLLRFPPVLSILKTMDHSARLGNSSETSAVKHGGAAAFFLPSSGRALLFPPPSNLYRTSRDQRLRKADTLSWVVFLKSPSASCISNLPSLAYS
jgi:hypothetical protein